MHKVTQLTESECAQEVKEITGNAFEKTPVIYFEGVIEGPTIQPSESLPISEPKRKRGRPVGSKNKPKEQK